MLFDRMSAEMVKALIETIPAELTVIDANDEVVGWNRHETRLFRRPMTAMGMNFRECHPQKSLEMVERIVGEMKAGQRDKATFWIDLEVGKGGPKHKIFRVFSVLSGSFWTDFISLPAYKSALSAADTLPPAVRNCAAG